MNNQQLPFFCTHFPPDRKLQREFSRGITLCNPWFLVSRLIYIAILLCFFGVMVLYFRAIETYALVIPLMVLFWMVPEWIRAFPHGKEDQIAYDSLAFHDHQILAADQKTGATAAFDYSRVKALWETRHLLLLVLADGQILAADKTCLNRTEFVAFLQAGCPALKGGTVIRSASGQLVQVLKYAVITLSLVVSILYHPWLQLQQASQDQFNNTMSVSAMLEELEGFGITCDDPQALAFLDNPLNYLPDTKLNRLLIHLGSGETDPATGEWTPAASGVLYTKYGGDDNYSETMYTRLLQGLAGICGGKITIENIEEDHSGASYKIRIGEIVLRFTLNGTPRSMTLDAYGKYQGWLDLHFFSNISRMIEEETGYPLYLAESANQTYFIFLGDAQWSQDFTRRSGIAVTCDMKDLVK